MSNKLDRRKTSFVIFVLTMIFFYLPLAVLVIYSFNNGKGMAWQGFSLRWYKELFRHSSNIWKAFYYSIFIALISSFVSTVIGTFGAIALKWFDFKGKKYLKNMVPIGTIDKNPVYFDKKDSSLYILRKKTSFLETVGSSLIMIIYVIIGKVNSKYYLTILGRLPYVIKRCAKNSIISGNIIRDK